MTPTPDSLDRWPELDAVFARALELSGAARAAYLKTACGDDTALRHEVEQLLAAHEVAAESFLEDPAAWVGELAPVPAPEDTPSAERAALWVGRRIGRYQVLEPIGVGGMGVLVQARDTQLDRVVTLKFLQPHLGTQPAAVQRFLQEAQAASALDHPNICTIYGLEETDDGQRCIAMAYYAGETLKDRIGNGPMPVREALEIARQIGAGLARAHEAGIVHRDLKPANVMLTDRGEVKILDFGIAKLAGSEEITATGARLGTAAYMSPEQAQGDPVDHRTDIWALGVVLYELVTGRRPFRGEHEQAVIYGILHEDPLAGADVPAAIAPVIRRALAKAPSARYPDMPALLDALDAARRGEPVPAPLGGPRSARVRWWAVAGISGVLVAASIGVWQGLGSNAPGPAGAAAAIPRLVVLPFENLGPPEDEYFADGITDETVTRLAKVGGLAVLARQSAMRYKGSDKTPQEIGEELGVDHILEATISWERLPDGTDRIRVRPQLIRVADGTHVWAEVYEAELSEVFRVQSEMAQRIAGALGIALLEPERRALAARPTEDLKAYDHYLRGNHYLLQRSRESVTRAIREYEAAVRLDSAFADAQARIAYALGLFADWGWEYPGLTTDSLLGWGFAMVDRALQLNPRSADAWMARAYLLAFRNPDTYEGVDQAFRQALTYDPNNAEAHHQYASMMIRLPGGAAAEAEFHRALALEPKLAVALVNLGFLRMAEGRPVEALELFDSAVAIDPLFAHAYEHRAHARIHNGQLGRARTDAESAIEATDGVLGRSILALVAANAGDTAEAHRLIAQLERERAPLHKEGRSWVIAAHIVLGELERAFALLERERRVIGLVYLRFLTRAPDFDAIRDDPRFQAIVGEGEDRQSTTSTRTPVLLVLPFENLGDARNDYFAEGVTDEIILRLAALPDVRVLARTTALHVRSSGRPLAEIGEALGVAYVLEGTVRWAPASAGRAERVRIVPRLIRLPDGTALWSEPVEGTVGDIFRLQTAIAERVAAGLEMRLPGTARSAPSVSDPAINAYLLGQFHLTRRTADGLQLAARYFRQALAIDSSFARAWAGLAAALGLYPTYGVGDLSMEDAFAGARHAASRALVIDSNLAEAQVALGMILSSDAWDWSGAIAAYDRAIDLAPQLAVAHHWRGEVLYITGAYDDALRAVGRALRLDPLSPVVNNTYGWMLARAGGKPRDAVPYFERARELSPRFSFPHFQLARVYALLGRLDDARASLGEGLRSFGLDPARADTVSAALGSTTTRIRSAAVAVLERWGREPQIPHVLIAFVLDVIGSRERVVAWLIEAYRERYATPMDVVDLLRRYRADPGAAAILRDLGLDDSRRASPNTRAGR